MEQIPNWLNTAFFYEHPFFYKTLITLIIALMLYFVRRWVAPMLVTREDDVKRAYYWSKWFTYLTYVIFIIVISPIWVTELHSIGTFLGLLTAGLAVALKEPISNFFAWMYIIIKKPFEMGDRIQMQNSEGDILDIGFFEFTLLEIKNWVKADQSTGRIIHIPNGLLFTHPVINYNQAMNYIWNEIPILITFESDWAKAKTILLDIENKFLDPLKEDTPAIESDVVKKRYHVSYNILTPTVYVRIEKNGVLLTLRYLCNPKKRRATEQKAFEAILIAFAAEPNIHFAYDTMRIYQSERKNT